MQPGKEILHPVAITIFGGLISSTLLDTFLTPVLFLRYGEKAIERLREARSSGHPASAQPKPTERPNVPIETPIPH